MENLITLLTINTVKLELKNSRMSSKRWINKQNKVLEFAFA